MEPGLVAAFYGVETAIEGAVGAAFAIAKSSMPLKGSFTRIPSKPIPRSSHSLSVIKGRAYIFGGEERPREPVDNAVHVLTIPGSTVEEADYRLVPAQASSDGGEIPSPRVGHTAAVVGDRIYVFGGRGGKEMKPLEEQGRVFVFDTKLNRWSHLDPPHGSPYPEGRSYHASTANEHPLPSDQDHTERPIGSPDLDDHGTVFIHGGCTAEGRQADVWAFDVASRTWSKFPDAPGVARGGPCLTVAQGRLYRFGGFDGKTELGQQIDYLKLSRSTFYDKGGHGELVVLPKGKWESIPFPTGKIGPGNRSVAGLQPITTGQGRNFLLLFLGETEPSSGGHESAGKFASDVWTFMLHPDGLTAASIKDATRQAVGAETGEGSWAEVEVPEATMKEGTVDHPGKRGWFASDVGDGKVVIWGGVNEDNERLGDGWLLTVE